MQARRAARELALILFSQFDKVITKYSTKEKKYYYMTKHSSTIGDALKESII